MRTPSGIQVRTFHPILAEPQMFFVTYVIPGQIVVDKLIGEFRVAGE